MLTLKQKLSKNYINARGWHTKRKLLLIESDDWGSVRMPSKEVYDRISSKGVGLDNNYFDKNDSLESVDDLEALFEILCSVKDFNGNPAILTAFSLVANPDFDKIQICKSREYHYELSRDTYKRQKHTLKSFAIMMEGYRNRIFHPQLHGREHINVKRWIDALNSESLKERLAFDNRAIISSPMNGDVYYCPISYFPAFDYTKAEEKPDLVQILEDALIKFEEVFGYKSLSFVSPCGILDNNMYNILYTNGVKLMPGQLTIPAENGKHIVRITYWGCQRGQPYLFWRRNCTFEPSRNSNYDWVGHCLKEIEIAFRWGKPAVINSHRVNFIGSIFPENRKITLNLLKKLLCEIRKNWPDVEFINTEQLALIMMESFKQ